DRVRLDHLDAEHHPAVLVLEIVAVEDVGLLARKRAGEIDCDPDAFAGPYENGILASRVGGETPAIIDLERGDLIRGRLPFQDFEGEAVQMHRMRHAVEVIADEPDFHAVALYFDRRLAHDEYAIVDAPLAFGEPETQGSLGRPSDV